MAILEAQHIEKHFGATPVLSDISFSLEEGQALSIIASSGYPREISFEIAMRCTPFYNPELKANQRPQDIADFLCDAYDRCRRFTIMVRGEQ